MFARFLRILYQNSDKAASNCAKLAALCRNLVQNSAKAASNCAKLAKLKIYGL
jgi:hypothetical protein